MAANVHANDQNIFIPLPPPAAASQTNGFGGFKPVVQVPQPPPIVTMKDAPPGDSGEPTATTGTTQPPQSYSEEHYPILRRYHIGEHPLLKEQKLKNLEPTSKFKAKMREKFISDKRYEEGLDEATLNRERTKSFLKGLDKQTDVYYARHFLKWLQGKSVYNHQSLTWWNTHNLFHIPGVLDYLKQATAMRHDFLHKLNILAKFGPTTLMEAEIYFKYIVLHYGLVSKKPDRNPEYMLIEGMLEFLDDFGLCTINDPKAGYVIPYKPSDPEQELAIDSSKNLKPIISTRDDDLVTVDMLRELVIDSLKVQSNAFTASLKSAIEPLENAIKEIKKASANPATQTKQIALAKKKAATNASTATTAALRTGGKYFRDTDAHMQTALAEIAKQQQQLEAERAEIARQMENYNNALANLEPTHAADQGALEIKTKLLERAKTREGKTRQKLKEHQELNKIALEAQAKTIEDMQGAINLYESRILELREAGVPEPAAPSDDLLDQLQAQKTYIDQADDMIAQLEAYKSDIDPIVNNQSNHITALEEQLRITQKKMHEYAERIGRIAAAKQAEAEYFEAQISKMQSQADQWHAAALLQPGNDDISKITRQKMAQLATYIEQRGPAHIDTQQTLSEEEQTLEAELEKEYHELAQIHRAWAQAKLAEPTTAPTLSTMEEYMDDEAVKRFKSIWGDAVPTADINHTSDEKWHNTPYEQWPKSVKIQRWNRAIAAALNDPAQPIGEFLQSYGFPADEVQDAVTRFSSNAMVPPYHPLDPKHSVNQARANELPMEQQIVELERMVAADEEYTRELQAETQARAQVPHNSKLTDDMEKTLYSALDETGIEIVLEKIKATTFDDEETRAAFAEAVERFFERIRQTNKKKKETLVDMVDAPADLRFDVQQPSLGIMREALGTISRSENEMRQMWAEQLDQSTPSLQFMKTVIRARNPNLYQAENIGSLGDQDYTLIHSMYMNIVRPSSSSGSYREK